MARYDHLPVYRLCYDLNLEVQKIVGEFPREYKYTLGEKIRTTLLHILLYCVRANRLTHKKSEILQMIVEMEFIKICLRMSTDLGIIPDKKYLQLLRKNEEILKQLEGWYTYQSHKEN